MNHENIIKELIESKEKYKEFLDKVEYCRNKSGNINRALNKYKEAVDKIISQINVNNIIDIQDCSYYNNNGYKYCLTSNGIRYRYVSGDYKSNSNDLNTTDYVKVIGNLIAKILSHPEISDFQKKKIEDIKDFNHVAVFDFEGNEIKFKTFLIKKLKTLNVKTELSVLNTQWTGGGYSSSKDLMDVELLFSRDQIELYVDMYYESVKNYIDHINSKINDIKDLYPLLFLFGDKK